MRTLVVTNDFPPRPGGIQAFVHALARRQPPGEVVVCHVAPGGKNRIVAVEQFKPFDD